MSRCSATSAHAILRAQEIREAKMGRWTALIDDMVAGRWINPETGKPGTVPYESVVIAESLEGREAELVTSIGIKGKIAVVCDENTRDVMGLRIAKALQAAHNSGISGVETIVLDHPHADEQHLAELREKTRHVDALVAVGSGTINDLCKYVTAQDGRGYCVFGTAPSMPRRRPISSPRASAIAWCGRWRSSTGGSRTACWTRSIPSCPSISRSPTSAS